MKSSIRVAAAVLVLAGLWGCGPEPLADAPAPELAQAAQGLDTSLPPVPAKPTDISAWDYPWKVPFVKDAQSAYVVVAQDPVTTKRFVAYGFDVHAHKTLFYVVGAREDYARFAAALAQDLAESQQLGFLDHGTGGAGQVGTKPVPGTPCCTIHGWAWKKALGQHELSLQYDAQPAVTTGTSVP